MATGNKRIIEGHTPGGPQEKRRKHKVRGVHPASVSGLGAAPVVGREGGVKTEQRGGSLCEHQRQERAGAKTAVAAASASISARGASAKTAAAAASASTSGRGAGAKTAAALASASLFRCDGLKISSMRR